MEGIGTKGTPGSLVLGRHAGVPTFPIMKYTFLIANLTHRHLWGCRTPVELSLLHVA